MNQTYQKGLLDYQNLVDVEKLRKKLMTDTSRKYQQYIAVQSGTIYVTNGVYMVAVKAESIEDGVYQVIKNKNEVVLLPIVDIQFPVCTEIEQLCPEYGDMVAFKRDIVSSCYCELIKAMGDDILDIDMFKQIYETKFFNYFKICSSKDTHKPIALFDTESESTKRAYIMPMVF